MLTLTENARTVVEELTAGSGLPETGGLRIAESPAQSGELELALVPEPVPGDEVVTSGAAHVFVAPEASEMLAHQSLDAESTPDGTGFTLVPQE